MITDPQRARKTDPGDPRVCNVFEFHKIYTDQQTVERIEHGCCRAEIGCVECKKIMAESLIEALAPIREKRAFYSDKPELVEEIIMTGSQKARKVAQRTMEEVRSVIKI
jgi:tryptophanyl-tRNA synthetase